MATIRMRPLWSQFNFTNLRKSPRSATVSLNSFTRFRTVTLISIPALAILFPFKKLECAGPERSYANKSSPIPSTPPIPGSVPPKAESIVDWKELSFGTVSGICAGVFVKKGLRAVAFAFGGIFVLLQYMASRGWVKVNWGTVSSSYDTYLAKRIPSGKGGRIGGLWNWIIDFLSADIQGRATFVAGVVLGIRLG